MEEKGDGEEDERNKDRLASSSCPLPLILSHQDAKHAVFRVLVPCGGPLLVPSPNTPLPFLTSYHPTPLTLPALPSSPPSSHSPLLVSSSFAFPLCPSPSSVSPPLPGLPPVPPLLLPTLTSLPSPLPPPSPLLQGALQLLCRVQIIQKRGRAGGKLAWKRQR